MAVNKFLSLATPVFLSLVTAVITHAPYMEEGNPFKHSTVHQELVDKVNRHPDAKWVAGTDDKDVARKRLIDYPDYVRKDWRQSNLLAPPDNQGVCGSCWAFAATHTLMDNQYIRNKETEGLSIQHVLECCQFTTCAGCEGAADIAAGLSFLSREFTVLADCKPYQGESRQCHAHCTNGHDPIVGQDHFSLKGFQRLSSNPDEIRAAVLNGPVLAGMTVYTDFYAYREGLYHHIAGNPVTLHAVEIVGFGTLWKQDYWIVKNSWGSTWGEEGYFRIFAGVDESQIEEFVVAPMFNGTTSLREEDPAMSTPLGGFQEADVNQEDIKEVAKFIANDVNPYCDDGKFDGISEYEKSHFSHVDTLSASWRADEGITFNALIEVSLPKCTPRMYINAYVHFGVNGTFELLSSRFIPKENIQKIRRGGEGGVTAMATVLWSMVLLTVALA